MFSRIIVKGLPGNCSEAKLRSAFSKLGTITDCSLKYTKEGKFRRFAYVGFSDEDSALEALKQFNGTYIGSSRITVEECKPFGDDAKPRAWSKYSKGSSAYRRAHPEEVVVSEKVTLDDPSPSISTNQQQDADYKRFLEVQEVHVEELGAVTSEAGNTDTLIEELLRDISGDTSLSAILCDLPCTVKQKNVKDWLSPVRIKGVKIVRNSANAAAFVTFLNRNDLKKALSRNGDYIGGFKITVKLIPGKGTSDKEAQEDFLFEDQKAEVEAVTNAILETGRLFIRNLPYGCTEDDIQFLFKQYGEVADVQFIINKKTNQSKGFAIITYVFPENAVAAYSALDGKIFKGRMLHILPGDEKRERKEEINLVENEKSSFKKEKMAKLQANAGKTHSWNALFLGANAVADTFAAKLQVEKSDLLSGEGETSAGVRLALAETSLVRQTREFLLSHGVSLDAFSRPAAKRSDTVIIAKNLPANVDTEELKRMFERFGAVRESIIPLGGITAIIVMENSVDARKAFSSLAYTRFRSQPLYLEWAPLDVFGKKDNKDSVEGSTLSESVSRKPSKRERESELTFEEKKKLRKSVKRQKLNLAVEEVEVQNAVLKEENKEEHFSENDLNQEVKEFDEASQQPVGKQDEEAEIGPGTTVFVKNLNFSSTEEALRLKFSSKFRVRSAVISKKYDIKDPSTSLSMGFGFVQFYRASDAQEAIKTMQGILLDGHCLELKLSNREEPDGKPEKRKFVSDLEQGERTKIHVKNIPFQASRKEVKQLFATFGELRAFRLPRKAGGSAESHRGFGFVDYLTRADARRAFNELVHSTHLYGKRLVLEWAKTDESVDELREKALNNLRVNKGDMMKRRKKLKEIEKDLATIDDD